MTGKWWFFVTHQPDERWAPRYIARLGTYGEAETFLQTQDYPGTFAIEKRWVVSA